MPEPKNQNNSKDLTWVPPPDCFPQEIIDLICTQSYSVKTLQALRLVSAIWSRGASIALFSHLDVSMDLVSLRNLDNVAHGKLAPLVTSLRFVNPREAAVLDSRAAPNSTNGSQPNSRILFGYASDNFPQMTASLTQSLRRLHKLKSADICPFMLPASRRAESDFDFNEPFRKVVFDALNAAMPPTLQTIGLTVPNTLDACHTYRDNSQAIDQLIGLSRSVNVDVMGVLDQRQSNDECHENLWTALAAKGSHLLGLQFNVLGQCWRTAADTSYHFTKLESLELTNFEASAVDLRQIVEKSILTIKDIKLRKVRLIGTRGEGYQGRFADFSDCLAKSKSLVSLDLDRMVYKDEWKLWFAKTRQRLTLLTSSLSTEGTTDFRDEPKGTWTRTPQFTPSWPMCCSQRPADLRACADLVITVNANRLNAGMQPQFHEPFRWSDIKMQPQWLLIMSKLAEKNCTSSEVGFWQDGALAGLGHRLDKEYPLRIPGSGREGSPMSFANDDCWSRLFSSREVL